MGVDAKGRNFSAPRLTPGVRKEYFSYGSPSMIKDQGRKIAVMEDRARRMGYSYSLNSAMLGGVTARALGTNEGYRKNAYTSPKIRNASSVASKVKIFIFLIILANILLRCLWVLY